MRDLDVSKKVDLLISVLMTYFFLIFFSFKLFGMDDSLKNYIYIEVVMIMAIFSYYYKFTGVIVVSFILDFAYINFNIYNYLIYEIPIGLEVYYWLILLPVTVVLVSMLAKNIREMQEKIQTIQGEGCKLIMIDEKTKLKNERAFLIELPMYMKMGRKHNIPITLFVIKVKYYEELINMLGSKAYDELLIMISKDFEETLREEDLKYIINDKKFALVMITDESGVETIKYKLKNKIKTTNHYINSISKAVKLEIQIGNYTLDENVKDSLQFIELAEKELEYDISE